MLRKVIRPFPYAADHIHVETLVPGDEREFPADIVDGLEAEGYIEGYPVEEASAENADQPVKRRGRPPKGAQQ